MHALELLVSTWGQSHAPSGAPVKIVSLHAAHRGTVHRGAGAAGAASIICRGRTRLHLPAGACQDAEKLSSFPAQQGLRDIEAEAGAALFETVRSW